MATRQRRNLLSSRRRVQDEGEEEDGAADAGDDSQSEGSVLTIEDGLDVDESDLSEVERQPEIPSRSSLIATNGTSRARKRRKNTSATQDAEPESTVAVNPTPAFENTADMEAMVNGMQIGEDIDPQVAIDFEDATEESTSRAKPQTSTNSTRQEARGRPTVAQRRIFEHQEYKAKRDADPSFVPNRGGFFMHDQRADGTGHYSAPGGRGRGRGRGVVPNGQQHARAPAPFAQGSTARWDHDLHESVIEPKRMVPSAPTTAQNVPVPTSGSVTRPVSMSKSTPIGAVLVRVFLPNMKAPVNIEKRLTVKQHTRLPDLRPPLRRDKPVRISLPDHAVRYIFPSVERSFIFIPRAQRPNQQRNRSRNRGFYTQTGSRRTSVFGGSNYTPSVAMSRHSSQARDGVASPAGSLYGRPPPGAPTGPARPVVKLPTGPRGASPSSVAAVSVTGTPFVSFPQGSAYPLPSQPAFREHRSSQMTMHQPRPQKQVSVATIESPEPVSFNVPQQQEQQPFHHQVPVQYSNQSTGEQPYYPQMGQMPVQGYVNGGTPLSNIPEGAINAQPFQPGLVPQQQAFYPYSFQQPVYYYPPPTQPADAQGNQYNGNPVTSPVYLQHGQYFVPMMLPVQPGTEDASSGPQPGTYAHESNGAVYYYDPTQLVDGGGTAAPGGPSTGGMVAQGPEAYFAPPHSDVYYYGQQ